VTDRFGKVAVLLGGLSAEREVSLKSGAMIHEGLKDRGIDACIIDADANVLNELKQAGADRAFIALHGPWGEDGVIQGALETIGLPYTGSGVLGCALSMDKIRSKQLWLGTGIPTPDFVELKEEQSLGLAIDELQFPLFVKPVHEGSSIGVTRVDSEDALEQAWRDAKELDDAVIAESGVEGPELTIAILQEWALPVIRLETPRTFYDYEAKYQCSTTRYLCPCGLPGDLESALQAQALRAFQLLGCSGWGRVDLMLDAQNSPYFLEVNTVPGMTDHSLVPMAAKQAGMEFSELTERILETSL